MTIWQYENVLYANFSHFLFVIYALALNFALINFFQLCYLTLSLWSLIYFILYCSVTCQWVSWTVWIYFIRISGYYWKHVNLCVYNRNDQTQMYIRWVKSLNLTTSALRSSTFPLEKQREILMTQLNICPCVTRRSIILEESFPNDLSRRRGLV